MHKLLIMLAATAMLAAPAHAAPEQQEAVTLVSAQEPAGELGLSLDNEREAAINRGLDWLAAQQKADGSWSDPDFPALTALALEAFLRSEYSGKEGIVDKAVAYLLTCVNEDGGIYRTIPGRKGGGLSNYNTAICMTALHMADRPALVPVVQKARKFLADAQHFGDDVYRGGFGYDKSTGRAYADLMNTYYAARAMRLTQDVEDLRPADEPRVQIDWKATVEYIERMQNPPGTGEANAGGFYYKPGESKAGTATTEEGKVVFRSYGSITYAGLLALIYADVSREDVRVRSAFDWAREHWTLAENPGMGDQGLYFFYSVLTRALAVYGVDLIPLPGGEFINWRAEMARKLVSLQEVDAETGHGFWVNENGRFWENNPVLVTAYSLQALQRL